MTTENFEACRHRWDWQRVVVVDARVVAYTPASCQRCGAVRAQSTVSTRHAGILPVAPGTPQVDDRPIGARR